MAAILDFFNLNLCKGPGSSVWDQCKGPAVSVWDLCKLLWSCQGSDPGSNLGKLLESDGNQGEVPVSGLSGEIGSTCVVDGPNT